MLRRYLHFVLALLAASLLSGCTCTTFYRYAGASDPQPYYRADMCRLVGTSYTTIRVKCSSAQPLPNEECK